MTSRDTHDIEEYEREQKTTNIQPALLIKLMMDAEPCLFVNQNKPATKPYELPPQLFISYAMCCNAAKSHAQEQIDFFNELDLVPVDVGR